MRVIVWSGKLVLCGSASSSQDTLVVGCDVGRMMTEVVWLFEG